VSVRRRKALAESADLAAWFRTKGQVEDGGASLEDREHLVRFLSEGRIRRMEEVLAGRTDRLLLVLDNLCDPHNLSAILRTAEGFGLQHVLLTGLVPEGVNPQIVRGAQRWLTIRRETDSRTALKALKDAGFTVAATVLSESAVSPREFRPEGPVALVMGNEHDGLGTVWVEGADVHLKIPMDGFVQSLNVSVAAGIFLFELLHKPALAKRHLPEGEVRSLSIAWVRKSVPHAGKILEQLKKKD
jgi:tRNA (guanosine-2'-O-)-methyltransferase